MRCMKARWDGIQDGTLSGFIQHMLVHAKARVGAILLENLVVASTRLQFLLVCMKTELVAGWNELGFSIHQFT